MRYITKKESLIAQEVTLAWILILISSFAEKDETLCVCSSLVQIQASDPKKSLQKWKLQLLPSCNFKQNGV